MQTNPEVLGSTAAPHTMKIEYCGGWNYKRHVINVIEEIEKRGPDRFKYLLYKDVGYTGRLEMIVFKDAKDDTGGGGKYVHSKDVC